MRAVDVALAPAPARFLRAKHSWSHRLGRLAIARYAWCQLTVVALMALNVFWRLSSTAISNMDEARYGVAASEMLRAHRFLVPTYGGSIEYWNLKPPLGYWLIDASYALFGRTVWALRLSSALCALAVVVLTMAFARRCFGRRSAILAGLFMATCYGFLSNHGARSGDLDAALTLLLLLALMQVPRLHDSAASRLAWGLLLTLGFLLKSFAILPFALTAMIYLAWTKARIPWRQWLPAVALFTGVVGGWALLRTFEDGTAYFVIRMTYEDLLLRSTHVIDNGSSSPWGYATALFDRFAPWPLFVILIWLYQSRYGRGRQRPIVLLLALWTLLPLCLFSLARTQHHWYLDPTYPAWAILAAVALLSLLRQLRAESSRTVILCTAALALIACETRLILRVTVRDQRPAAQNFLASLRDCVRPEGESLQTTFALSHSERFILQVMDGFDVREPAGQDADPTTPPVRPGLVLDSRRTGFAALRDRRVNPAIIARSDDYLLIDNATGIPDTTFVDGRHAGTQWHCNDTVAAR